ncbi:MAG: patatin family protein [Schaedlerella sp.]|nr:patatin family protein [Schaedlerella sp.]
MKTGLVLEGGGMRGLYSAGILDAFIEKKIYFDGVIGVSAGAIHGCSFVSRQKGRSIRYYKEYCKDPRFMSFKNLITTGDYIGEDFCYHELPEKLDIYDYEAFNNSSTDFYATCTNLETGKAEHFHITDMLEQIDILRASASLPFVSRIVTIDGKDYLDGGCSDGVPVEAFQNMGYNRNVVILTREKGYRKKTEHTGLIAKKYSKYPEFVKTMENRHIEYNKMIKRIEQMEKEGQILIIRPRNALSIGRLENDVEKLQRIYNIGYADGLKAAEKIRIFLA